MLGDNGGGGGGNNGGGAFIKSEVMMDQSMNSSAANMSAALVDEAATNEGQQLLETFWQRCMEDCVNLNPNTDFKVQELPLARIKKIMKLDEEVKMISAEAPIIFAKACELFVAELTTRAWIHTEESKRRTLQKTDVAMAVSKYDMFDFLIDIVPRDEIKGGNQGGQGGGIGGQKGGRGGSMSGADQVQYLVQLPASALNSSNGGQPITLNFGGQQILINTSTDESDVGTTNASQILSSGGGNNQSDPSDSQQLIQIPINQVLYSNENNSAVNEVSNAAGTVVSDASSFAMSVSAVANGTQQQQQQHIQMTTGSGNSSNGVILVQQAPHNSQAMNSQQQQQHVITGPGGNATVVHLQNVSSNMAGQQHHQAYYTNNNTGGQDM